MANVGFATLQIIPSFQGTGAKLTEGLGGPAEAAGRKAGDKAGKGFAAGLASASGKATDVGNKLTLGLTLPIVGIGIAAFKAADDFDAAVAQIRGSTGATGVELAGLTDVFKTVNREVPQAMGVVAETVGDLARRTGLTGDALAVMSKQLLDLSDITGSNVNVLIATTTRLFADWAVSTKKQSDTLDVLFRISQATGSSVDDLAGGLVRFGAPLRQLGFSMTEGALLLGKFEKEGVNTKLVLGSMRVALGKMAKAGEEPIDTFRRTVDAIKNTGSVAKANKLALELFGARAGPDMAEAIRQGRFELDKLAEQVATSTETIESADNATDTAGERMAILGKRIQESLIPVGEKLIEVFDILAPHIISLADAFTNLTPRQQAWVAIGLSSLAVAGPLLSIIGRMGAGIGVLAKGFRVLGGVKAFKFLGGGTLKGLKGLGKVLPVVGRWFARLGPLLGGALLKGFRFLKGALPLLGDLFVVLRTGIMLATKAVWAFTVSLLANPVGLIIAAIVALVAVFVILWIKCKWFRDFWKGLWNVIKEAALAVGRFFRDVVWGQWLKPAFEQIGAIASWLWNKALKPFLDHMAEGFGILMRIVRSVGAIFLWLGRTIVTPIVRGLVLGAKLVGAGFSWLWRNAIKPAFTGIAALFGWIWGKIIKPGFDRIMSKIGAVRDRFKAIFSAIGGFVKSAFSNAVGFVRSAINGVIGVVNSAIRFINNNLISSLNKIPGVDLPGLRTIPGLASGGTVTRPGLVEVGERGPETLFLPQGASVIPRQPLGPRSAPARVVIDVTGGDEDLRRVIRKWTRNSGRGNVQVMFGRRTAGATA